jgi:flagellar motor protein MotB
MKYKLISLRLMIVLCAIIAFFVSYSLISNNDKQSSSLVKPIATNTVDTSNSHLDSQEKQIQRKNHLSESLEITEQRQSYSETLKHWHNQQMKLTQTKPQEEKSTTLDKKLSQLAIQEKVKQSDVNKSSDYLSYYKNIINFLIEVNEIELAFDYVTELYRINSEDKEIQSTYSAIYRLYTDKIVEKQKQIIGGGTE